MVQTKQKIQNSFKEEIGLLVDFPKAGLKDSNDGNTSKRFLADPQTSSYITGADINSIKKKLILTNLQKQLQKFAFNHMDDTQ